MSYQATGKVMTVGTTQQVSEKFRKREVILLIDDGKYPQTCAFEFAQDKVQDLDPVSVGDLVRVDFDLRGRQWTSPKGEVKTFNTLSAWRLETLTNAEPQAGAPADVADDGDIPFATIVELCLGHVHQPGKRAL